MIIKKRYLKYSFYAIILFALIYFFFFRATYPTIHTVKPIYGNSDAKVKIVEFGDLQCPGCKAAEPSIETIKAEFKNSISFQFYHFPIMQKHVYAQKAAEAAECANDQGKFFEFIELAYKFSPELQTANLKEIAKQVGLDVKNFTACLNSGAKWSEVNTDYELGIAKNVQGTPTIFINGKIAPNWDVQTLRDMIKKAQ